MLETQDGPRGVRMTCCHEAHCKSQGLNLAPQKPWALSSSCPTDRVGREPAKRVNKRVAASQEGTGGE